MYLQTKTCNSLTMVAFQFGPVHSKIEPSHTGYISACKGVSATCTGCIKKSKSNFSMPLCNNYWAYQVEHNFFIIIKTKVLAVECMP